jgi:hypothetical protein
VGKNRKPAAPTPGPELAFRVPRWCPPSLNAVFGRHFAAAHRIKKALADLLGVFSRAAGVRPVDLRYRPVRRVRLTVTGWGNGETMPDPDNLLKLFLDSCTRCRLIVDDSADWCDWARPTLIRGSPDEAVVTVRDLRLRPPCDKPEHDPQTRRMLAALLGRYRNVHATAPKTATGRAKRNRGG